MKRGPQKTVKGAYSGDFEESDLMKDELNWMPGSQPNVYVRDTQAKLPGVDWSGKIDVDLWDWRPGPTSEKVPLKALKKR